MLRMHTHLVHESNVCAAEGNDTYNFTSSYVKDIRILLNSYFNNHIPVTHKSPM